jgi:ABC-type glycerol-3-phosphate transport system substrate-binding protein
MSARRTWKRCVSAGVVVASLTVGASAVTAVSAGAANSTTCPLVALQKAGKPVEITMWHWMTRANETTLQKIVDGFNSSQRDVKVNLVNQVDWEATLAKYKSGLASRISSR